MCAQWCRLGRDASCPRAQKRLWGSRNEMSSALGQASALLLYLPFLQPQCHTSLNSKAMGINIWWPWHEDQNASTHFPATDGQGNCSSMANSAMSKWWRWSFTASSAPTWFIFWSPHQWSQDRDATVGAPRAELRYGWADRQGETWVCHRAQDSFLGGKLNSRIKGKHRGWQSVSGGVRVQEAGAVHQPGAGLPGTGNCSHSDIQPHSKCILIIQ